MLYNPIVKSFFYRLIDFWIYPRLGILDQKILSYLIALRFDLAAQNL